MAVFSGAKRIVWWAVDAGLPNPTTSGKVFMRADRTSTGVWVTGQQDEKVATGDNFITVDSIPNGPHAEIGIDVDWFPITLLPFLANCCLVPGAAGVSGPLIPPVSMTIGFLDGLDSREFAGCQISGNPTLTLGNPCKWHFPFIGTEKPVTASAPSITLPAWERPYRKNDLRLSTLIGSATPLTEKKFRNLVLSIVCTNTPLYDTRGDGLDGVSDMVLDELGATLSLDRAYSTATEKAAFLAECGTDGIITLPFTNSCGGVTTTSTFTFPRGRYTAESITAQQNDDIREPLVAVGLRPLSADANSGFSPLGFSWTSA